MLTRLRHRAHGQEGFTLIELLVVILIIGILAAVAIPAFVNQKGKAQDAAIKADINTTQTAEETYYTDNQTYGSTSGNLTAIEPTLANAFLAPESLALSGVSNTGYTITANSKSGIIYTLANASGVITRGCTVPANTNPSGCKGATQVTTGTSSGSW
jgi:type IV pilus assembly protein PilA